MELPQRNLSQLRRLSFPQQQVIVATHTRFDLSFRVRARAGYAAHRQLRVLPVFPVGVVGDNLPPEFLDSVLNIHCPRMSAREYRRILAR